MINSCHVINTIGGEKLHTHVRRGDRQGCEKDSLEIVTKQVRLGDGLERGGRIRIEECLRQTVPNRWASVRKWSITKSVCDYTRGDKGSGVRYGS